MKHDTFRPEFVEFIPELPLMEEGVLYISLKYQVANHLCFCGCREQTVTPLGPSEWQLTHVGSLVSLHPSIGNWQMPCRSHYWIEANQVKWL